jgi:hypothetical protein
MPVFTYYLTTITVNPVKEKGLAVVSNHRHFLLKPYYATTLRSIVVTSQIKPRYFSFHWDTNLYTDGSK